MKNNNTIQTALILFVITTILTLVTVKAFAHDHGPEATEEELIREHEQLMAEENEPYQDDMELLPEEMMFSIRGCKAATTAQLATVNSGNAKRTQFQDECVKTTGSSTFCLQVERPNPSSKSVFACTYGTSQVHRLIHPTTSTWKNATKAIVLLKRLSASGICVSQIYNWWRPEPYNANVGGAAGRHPFGTSVDVRFCTNSDAIKAFDKLCTYRKAGELRALGYYGSTGVHIGVGDNTANTWGRSCP